MPTPLARRLGLRHPLVLAPMAGETASAALVAAVSAAGGLGSLGAAYMTPEAIAAACREIRERTDAPFAINLFAPMEVQAADPAQVARYRARLAAFHTAAGLPEPPTESPAGPAFAAQLDALLDGKAPVFSTTFGLIPAAAMARLKAAGVVTIGTATTPAEARAVEAAGFDAVMAQGFEAGGHRGGFTGARAEGDLIGTLALVPQVVDAVDIPVIAAGGISDGRGLAAALLLGAEAAALGTAFLRAAECPLNDGGKAALAAADAGSTTLTRAFSGRLARGLANGVTEAFADGDIPPFPVPNGLTRPLRSHAAQTRDAGLTSVWAGQAAALARAEPAAAIVARVMAEARAALAAAPAL
ncbi:NAD(P)H-dependent flavin oxidoreductase [Caenispirillum bisanense]|uniref:Propionate 3-nitronate monooxygenase n=1 Tax=Caenispirillum bisanense TaxID=414052 RepID=A0A286GA19_9PROT|nr:nitronate monooxygenase [Caenispirillum bisanense]SOD92076.1 nitronate monooxygenase [Caenispirillum bisanense]